MIFAPIDPKKGNWTVTKIWIRVDKVLIQLLCPCAPALVRLNANNICPIKSVLLKIPWPSISG